ncbi:MAG: hypothetical protein R2727_11740 [Bacteroidales bacterium]
MDFRQSYSTTTVGQMASFWVTKALLVSQGGEGATVILVAKNTTSADEINGGLWVGEKGVGGSQAVRNYGLEYADAVRFNGSNQIYDNGHTLNAWKIVVYQNQDGSQAQDYQAYLDGTLLGGTASYKCAQYNSNMGTSWSN